MNTKLGHAVQRTFSEQPMQRLCELYGPGFALGQAAKKAQESMRLPTVERQVAELLGAINYLAGAVIHLERHLPANDNEPQDYVQRVAEGCIRLGGACTSPGPCLHAGHCQG
jgi:hypothetical protein